MAELTALPGRIRDLTTSDPAALAVQARQRSSQLKTLARQLEIVAEKVSVESVSASKQLLSDLDDARERAAEVQRVLQDEGGIPGTGGEEWQQLWNAAKTFTGLDHEHEFPVLTGGTASCPLCQQALQDSAIERFRRFAEFMRGEAQSQLATARLIRNADIEALNSLPLDSLVTQDLVDLICTYDEEVGGSLLQAIGEAASIRKHLLEPDEEVESFDAATLAGLLLKAIESLREAAGREETSAETLATTDASSVAVAQLEARRQELTIRMGLAAERDEIAAQHDRTLRIAQLEVSRGSCSTTSASRKNSDLSASYVEKVCLRFEEETRKLGVYRVPVELVFDRSSRGVSYIKVSLKGAPQVPVASVLSEGEQRVTAIAGFFADLTESGDHSTLVFDDPVSSLDQVFRVKVAQRLLEESELRQVVVFTHDFSFVQYLYEEKAFRDKQARADGGVAATDINYLHIERSAHGAGVVTTAEEWRHVNVKERIGRIKQRIQAAGVLHRSNDLTAYEAQARDIVGAIRDTWEAFVEQDLLNGVVTRHDRRVQTQKLLKLVDLTDADIATVDLGMSIESRFMTGHAAPISDGSAAMAPDDLSLEIKRLEDLRSAINIRRR